MKFCLYLSNIAKLSKMATLSSDLDEMSSEASMSEEKAQRAMIDAARCQTEPKYFTFFIYHL